MCTGRTRIGNERTNHRRLQCTISKVTNGWLKQMLPKALMQREIMRELRHTTNGVRRSVARQSHHSIR